MNGDTVIQTQRLTLREVDAGDAAFFLRLVNEPSFLQHIGDKGVRNLADASHYIQSGPMASYAQHGFGLYLVALKGDGTCIGSCGLLKRDDLADPDIGFAFLPEYWSQGYAFEAAQAVIDRSEKILSLQRVVAVTAPDNSSSIGLLSRLGFLFEKKLDSFGDSGECNLYSRDL